MFVRDWEIDGEPFRTTWLAGWWLERVMLLDRRHFPILQNLLHAK